MLNLLGKKFIRLTVIHKANNNKYGKSQWLCRCDCGKEIIVTGSSLKIGNTKSCGCLQLDRLAETFTKHGHAKNNQKSRIYRTWVHMVQRCINPSDKKYTRYGGRGIIVCKRWMKFENFLKDMGEPLTKNHSIDRIDNNGDYCKSNCRWATSKQQSRNTSKNRLITYNGEAKCLAQWSEETGIRRSTIASRLASGWPIEKVFVKPFSTRGNQ